MPRLLDESLGLDLNLSDDTYARLMGGASASGGGAGDMQRFEADGLSFDVDRDTYSRLFGAEELRDPFADDEGVGLKDFGAAIMRGGASVARGVGWLLDKWGPMEPAANAINDAADSAIDYWTEKMSPAAKEELSKQFLTVEDDGDWWNPADWNRGEAGVTTALLLGAESLTGTAAGMGAGGLITRGLAGTLKTFGNPVGIKALRETVKRGGPTASPAAQAAAKSAQKKLNFINDALSVTGFGLGEGAVGALMAGQSVHEQVMSMDHFELLENSPEYRQIFDATDVGDLASEAERIEYAKDSLARRASSEAGWRSGLTTSLLGAPMGALYGRIMGPFRKPMEIGRLRGAAAGAAGESAQEFAQSGAEQYISNVAVQRADPSRPATEGILEAAVAGAAAGAPLGGAVGFAGATTKKQAEAKEKAEEGRKKLLSGYGEQQRQTVAEAAARTQRALVTSGMDESAAQERVDEVLKRYADTGKTAPALADLRVLGETGEQRDTAERRVDSAAAEAATSPENDLPEPTEPQIGAGNYKKGHVNMHGMRFAIESPKGAERNGSTLAHHYGYINRTVGEDGDQVDVFFGDHFEDPGAPVFVVETMKDGELDEHKVMMGFAKSGESPDKRFIRRQLLANYGDMPEDFVGEVHEMSMEEFKAWAGQRATSMVSRETSDIQGEEGAGSDGKQTLSVREQAPTGAEELPPVPRGVDAQASPDAQAESDAEDEGQLSVVRGGVPAQGEDRAEAVPEVREAESGDAPRGLRPASEGGVAVPSVPSGGAQELVKTQVGEVIAERPETEPAEYTFPDTPGARKFAKETAVKEGDEPAVVYHATDAEEFAEFDPTKLGKTTTHPTAKLGFFFSNSKEGAANYLRLPSAQRNPGGTPRVMPVWLNIRNPKVVSFHDDIFEDFDGDAEELRQKWIAEGFDGVKMTMPGGETYWVAFSPEQIKSVGNSGEFGDTPDIRYNLKQEQQQRPEPTDVEPSHPALTATTTNGHPSVRAVGVHHGRIPGLMNLHGKKFGDGAPGLERLRVNAAKDPRLKNRVYFYLRGEQIDAPEQDVGTLNQYVYTVTAHDLYDMQADPLGLKDMSPNEFELHLMDLGYSGYVNSGFTIPAGVSFKDLEATYHGRRANLRGKFLEEPDLSRHLVPWESFPSTSTALGTAVAELPEYLKHLYHDDQMAVVMDHGTGRDMLADALGAKNRVVAKSYGAYAKRVALNSVVGLDTADQATAYAEATRIIYQQDATPWIRAREGGPIKALALTLPGGWTLPAQQRFLKALEAELGEGAGFTRTDPNTVVVANFQQLADDAFASVVQEAASKSVKSATINTLSVEGAYHDEANPQEILADRAAAVGASDLPARVRSWANDAQGRAHRFFEELQRTISEARTDRWGRVEFRGRWFDLRELEQATRGARAQFGNVIPRRSLYHLKRKHEVSAGGPLDASSWAARGTDGPAFRKWFGKSRITDEGGEPAVMYHGSLENIEDFMPNEDGLIFFTPNPRLADWFAYANSQKIAEAEAGLSDPYTLFGTVYPVYVRAENPFDFRKRSHTKRLQKALAKEYGKDSAETITQRIREGYFSTLEKPFVTAKIRELGFDSLIVREYTNEQAESARADDPNLALNIAVFSPSQAKSVFNRGTWLPTSRYISYHAKEQQGEGDDLVSEMVRRIELFQMERVVERMLPQGAGEKQIAAFLQNGVNEGFFSRDIVEVSGLSGVKTKPGLLKRIKEQYEHGPAVGQARRALHMRNVMNEVRWLRSQWKNAPRVSVHETVEGLPTHLLWQVRKDRVERRVGGLFDRLTGNVHIIAGNIGSLQELHEVLIEESLGHYGLHEVFGGDLDVFLRDILPDVQGTPEFQRLAENYSFLAGEGEQGQLHLAEELLTRLEVNQSVWQRFVAWVRAWLRKHGFITRYNEGDLRRIMRMVHSHVQNGDTPHPWSKRNPNEGVYVQGPKGVMYHIEHDSVIFGGRSNMALALEEKGPGKATIKEWMRLMGTMGPKWGFKKTEFENTVQRLLDAPMAMAARAMERKEGDIFGTRQFAAATSLMKRALNADRIPDGVRFDELVVTKDDLLAWLDEHLPTLVKKDVAELGGGRRSAIMDNVEFVIDPDNYGRYEVDDDGLEQLIDDLMADEDEWSVLDVSSYYDEERLTEIELEAEEGDYDAEEMIEEEFGFNPREPVGPDNHTDEMADDLREVLRENNIDVYTSGIYDIDMMYEGSRVTTVGTVTWNGESSYGFANFSNPFDALSNDVDSLEDAAEWASENRYDYEEEIISSVESALDINIEGEGNYLWKDWTITRKIGGLFEERDYAEWVYEWEDPTSSRAFTPFMALMDNSHFEESENTVFHLRVADQMIEVDGERVWSFMTHEGQSDWTNQTRGEFKPTVFDGGESRGTLIGRLVGRLGVDADVGTKGYISRKILAAARTDPTLLAMLGANFDDEETARLRKEAVAALEQEIKGAEMWYPFRDNWHELTFRQALAEAIESGHEWMTWPTGDQQVQIYGGQGSGRTEGGLNLLNPGGFESGSYETTKSKLQMFRRGGDSGRLLADFVEEVYRNFGDEVLAGLEYVAAEAPERPWMGSEVLGDKRFESVKIKPSGMRTETGPMNLMVSAEFSEPIHERGNMHRMEYDVSWPSQAKKLDKSAYRMVKAGEKKVNRITEEVAVTTVLRGPPEKFVDWETFRQEMLDAGVIGEDEYQLADTPNTVGGGWIEVWVAVSVRPIDRSKEPRMDTRERAEEAARVNRWFDEGLEKPRAGPTENGYITGRVYRMAVTKFHTANEGFIYRTIGDLVPVEGEETGNGSSIKEMLDEVFRNTEEGLSDEAKAARSEVSKKAAQSLEESGAFGLRFSPWAVANGHIRSIAQWGGHTDPLLPGGPLRAHHSDVTTYPIQMDVMEDIEVHGLRITDQVVEKARRFALYSLKRAEGPADVEAIIRRKMSPPATQVSLADTVRDRIRSWKQSWEENGVWALKQGMLDAGASIERLERGINDGRLLDATESAFKMYGFTKNLPSVMMAIMKAGIPVFRDGVFQPEPGRKGFIEVFRPLFEGEKNTLHLWEFYAAARRAKALKAQRNPDGTEREKLFTDEEIEKGLALGEQYPVFKQVFDDWTTFNNQLLGLAVDRGALSEAEREVWAANDYVPFFRAMEDVEGIGEQAGLGLHKRGLSGQSHGRRRLWGSEKRLGNIMENMLLNTASLVDRVYKNEAMNRIVDMGEGIVMTEVDLPWEAVRVTNEQLASALGQAGLLAGDPNTEAAGAANRAKRQRGVPDSWLNVVEKMSTQQKLQWATVFRRVAPTAPNIVAVSRGGKLRFYEVSDPLLLKTIKDMGEDQFAGFMRAFGFSKKLLTRAVTLDPGFMLANWLRDTLSAWVTSEANFIPVMGAIKGAKSVLREDSDYIRMMMAGAGGGGFYDMSGGEVQKVLADEKSRVDGRGLGRKLWRGYMKIGAASENSNRLAIAQRVMQQGGTVAEGMYQAQDILNFTMSGQHEAIKFLTRTVPFMNARIQGLYRLYRGAKEHPGGFALKGMAIMGASLMLLARNWDDEDYEALPDWRKDTDWNFFIGGMHYTIPKPFEVGVIFGTLPERMVRLLAGRDDSEIAGERLMTAVSETFAMNPVPQLVKPMVELYANRSMFTGAPIVNLSMGGVLPEYQAHPWTSETAMTLAEAMPDFMPEALRSPARIEHLVRAYTGSVGMYALGMSDAATRGALGLPEAPTRKWSEYPPFTRVMKGDPGTSRHNKYVDRLYSLLDEADATYRSINALKKKSRGDEALRLQQENRDLLAARKQLHNINKELRNINTASRAVRSNPGLTSEEKRLRIDELNRRRNRIFNDAGPLIESL